MSDLQHSAADGVGQAHTLAGFGSAAVKFVRALELNQERVALDEGLTASELRTLFHIGTKVRVTPKELADYFGMTTGAITFIARRLVDAGLLHRVDHPKDRRSIYLELTPLAHTKLDIIHGEFEVMIEDSTRSLDPDELDRFTRALSEVADEVFVRLNELESKASKPR
jgi:DNA-binding MarR family transcriptional regulator